MILLSLFIYIHISVQNKIIAACTNHLHIAQVNNITLYTVIASGSLAQRTFILYSNNIFITHNSNSKSSQLDKAWKIGEPLVAMKRHCARGAICFVKHILK